MTAPSEAQFDFDIGTIDFWAQPARVRDEAFAQLRREAPVSHHPPAEDAARNRTGEEKGYWAISKYEDIRAVSRDPKTFQSGKGVLFGEAPPEMLEASQSFLAMDAPRHTKLRGLVSAAFTPRQVKRIEDGIRTRAKEIVAEAVPQGEGDFVELVAKRLPLVTISDMVGVPEADRERVVEAADALVTVPTRRSSSGRPLLEVMGARSVDATEFATELAKERERSPKDDLMTALVEAEIDGEKLTPRRSPPSSCCSRSPATTPRATPRRTASRRSPTTRTSARSASRTSTTGRHGGRGDGALGDARC